MTAVEHALIDAVLHGSDSAIRSARAALVEERLSPEMREEGITLMVAHMLTARALDDYWKRFPVWGDAIVPHYNLIESEARTRCT